MSESKICAVIVQLRAERGGGEREGTRVCLVCVCANSDASEVQLSSHIIHLLRINTRLETFLHHRTVSAQINQAEVLVVVFSPFNP